MTLKYILFLNFIVFLTIMSNSVLYSQTESYIEKTLKQTVLLTTIVDEKTLFGTGIIIKKENDYIYILTNSHVIDAKASDNLKIFQRQKINVTFYDYKQYPGFVVWFGNPKLDLAILIVYVTEKKNYYEEIKYSIKEPQLKENVYTIGNPEGLSFSISKGTITSFKKLLENLVIQSNVDVSPGNSGGGLFNSSGELIGLISYKGEKSILSYAIYFDHEIIFEILSGLNFDDITSPSAHYYIAFNLILKEKYDNAIIQLKNVLSSVPNHQISCYFLSCCYSQQHDIPNSNYWLDRAVESGFNDWNVLLIDSRLNNLKYSKIQEPIVGDYNLHLIESYVPKNLLDIEEDELFLLKVRIDIDDERYISKVCANTLFPKWNEIFSTNINQDSKMIISLIQETGTAPIIEEKEIWTMSIEDGLVKSKRNYDNNNVFFIGDILIISNEDFKLVLSFEKDTSFIFDRTLNENLEKNIESNNALEEIN